MAEVVAEVVVAAEAVVVVAGAVVVAVEDAVVVVAVAEEVPRVVPRASSGNFCSYVPTTESKSWQIMQVFGTSLA